MSSDIFIHKLKENISSDIPLVNIKEVIDAISDTVLDLVPKDSICTLDGVLTFCPGNRTQHSPKYRKFYLGTKIVVRPKLYYTCNTYDLHEYCYELQWYSDLSSLPTWSHYKIATWCRLRQKRMLKKGVPKESIVRKLTEQAKGLLSEDEVKFYLKHPPVPTPKT